MKLPRSLQNQYIAIAFVLLIVCALSFISKSWWGILSSMVLSFILADLVMSFTVKTNRKGHNFLYFLLFIIISTIISGLFADKIISIVAGFDVWTFIIANAIIFFLVYVDYNLRTKGKIKG